MLKQETLLEVLMRRDQMTKEDAQELIDDARERIAEGEDPEQILYYDFRLEPDYIFDLL